MYYKRTMSLGQRTNPEKAGGTAERILEYAREAFNERGVAAVGVREIARDLGLSPGNVSYHFPTKEALIRAVIGHAVGRFQATMPTQGAAVDQLRGHLRALAHLLKTDAQLWAVMGELVLRAPRDQKLAAIFRQTDDYWHRTLADLIQRCIQEVTIDADLDAAGTARLLIVAIKGMSLPTLAGSPQEIADQVFGQFERLLGLTGLQ